MARRPRAERLWEVERQRNASNSARIVCGRQTIHPEGGCSQKGGSWCVQPLLKSLWYILQMYPFCFPNKKHLWINNSNLFLFLLSGLESRDQEHFGTVPDNLEQVLKLWKSIFDKSYEATTEEDLHLFTHNLLQRLFVLSKYPPSAFGSLLSKLLIHPNLHIIDKNVNTSIHFNWQN